MNNKFPLASSSNALEPKNLMKPYLCPAKNDISIEITRKEGRWTVHFTGFPLPKDVQQAQKALSDTYRGHRREIAKSFNRTKAEHKRFQDENKVIQRKLKEAQRATNALKNKKEECTTKMEGQLNDRVK